VVVDELHTVGEVGRGAGWEAAMAKLLYAAESQPLQVLYSYAGPSQNIRTSPLVLREQQV
jgi:hypothetical protein